MTIIFNSIINFVILSSSQQYLNN